MLYKFLAIVHYPGKYYIGPVCILLPDFKLAFLQKDSLSDMDRTLIRNLSDHLGNNLLHVVAR